MTSSYFLSSLSARSFRESLLLALPALLFLFPMVRSLRAQTPTPAIKVDQVGYPLDGPKIAIVSTSAHSFQLKQSSDQRVVFQGNLSVPQADAATGDQVQAADFSSFRKPGTYYIEVAGVGRSWNFVLARNPFERA